MRAVDDGVQLQLREGVFNGVGDEEKLAVFLLEHALGDAMVKESQEWVVEAVGVEQKNRLGVDFECVPGEDFEEFFEGAVASGQCDECVGAVGHHRLTRVHGTGNVEFGHAMMGNFKIDERLGNNADDAAASFKGSVCNCFHQSDIGSAVDEADVAIGKHAAQLLGCVAIDGVRTIGGGTEDRDVANHEARISSVRRGSRADRLGCAAIGLNPEH